MGSRCKQVGNFILTYLLNHDERESWVFSSGDHNVNNKKKSVVVRSAQITSNPTFREQYEFHPLSSFSSSPYPFSSFALFLGFYLGFDWDLQLGFFSFLFFNQKNNLFFSICTQLLTFGLP
jgi:hypothetical protein